MALSVIRRNGPRSITRIHRQPTVKDKNQLEFTGSSLNKPTVESPVFSEKTRGHFARVPRKADLIGEKRHSHNAVDIKAASDHFETLATGQIEQGGPWITRPLEPPLP